MSAAMPLVGLFDESGGTPAAVEKLCTMEDQEAFARLSGDRNPMHMDFAVGRRTQGGGCVVHGVQTTLWALEQLAANGLDISQAEALNVSFSRFIVVGQRVRLVFSRKGPAMAKAEILCADQAAVSITFKAKGRAAAASSSDALAYPDFDLTDRPAEPTRSEMLAFAQWIPACAVQAAFEEAYPHACACLGARKLMGLAALSTLVGMACPGVNSIFSGFALQWTSPRSERVGAGARTTAYDDRTRLMQIAVDSADFTGTVSAFERFPPLDAPLDRIREMTEPGEFAGRRALVLGGSRGLGATTAKILAAGGAKVVITYHLGKVDAQKVCAELNSAFGDDCCKIAHVDVRNFSSAEIAALAEGATHIYYFATSQIASARSGAFDAAVFDGFAAIYVRAFYEIVEAILQDRRGERTCVFYPSSIFVEQRPKNMTEYAMAKAAGEILCQDLARNRAGLSIAAPRLPRVLTDQTATVPPVEAADAIVIMLPHLRAEAAPPA